MRFDSVIIALLVAVALIWCGTVIVDDQFSSDHYNITIDNEVFANITNTSEKIYVAGSGSKEDYANAQLDATNAEDNLFVAGWKTVGTIWTYFGYIDDIVIQFAKAFGIPGYLVQLFMIMLMIATVFGIAYMIFGHNPR